jgi:hypothetical protein
MRWSFVTSCSGSYAVGISAFSRLLKRTAEEVFSITPPATSAAWRLTEAVRFWIAASRLSL